MEQSGPAQTLLEQLIRARTATLSELCDEFHKVARERGEPATLTPRHLQRLASGARTGAMPTTRRVLEAMWNEPFVRLIGPSQAPLSGFFTEHDGQKSTTTSAASTSSNQVSAHGQWGAFNFVPVTNGAVNGDTSDALTIQAFRAADMQVGGGHLYDSVVKYLHTDVAPRLFGGDHNSQFLFTAASALTEMAGWMAHDAGRDNSAQQHFIRALDFVTVAGDHQLGAHVRASMSHLAHHHGQPDHAVRLSRAGQEVLRRAGPCNPDLESRLLAMEARGYAARGQAAECGQLLNCAEQALCASAEKPLSQWVSRFDEGSLATEAARCMFQLGDLGEARRQAERIIELRSIDRRRSRAFGQLILGSVLISQGKIEDACAVLQQVLDFTQSLGSYLVTQQLLDLKELLEPCRSSKVVAEFLLGLEEALRERFWLCQWLARDGVGHMIGYREAR